MLFRVQRSEKKRNFTLNFTGFTNPSG